jgi:aspartate aminotransferase-like enzyme
MTQTRSLTFKIADEPSEFEQIHRLNYEAFVVEIPQHPRNTEGLLIDRFHAQNNYVICKSTDRVLGMMAVREQRPFSLEQKLEDLWSYLPDHRAVCELRLLAVNKEHRNSRVFQGLLLKVSEICEGRGYDLAIMSGTIRQLKLYRQLGFEPFGPLVGSGDAIFQPMYLTLNAYRDLKARKKTFLHLAMTPDERRREVALLPGPVSISPTVRQSFAGAPISHRSKSFLEDFAQTRQMLCRLTRAKHAEIFLGSGTLANDVIAGQISLIPGTGLVLSNGEFGNRLIDHATRFRLRFRTLKGDWGQPFSPDEIRKVIKESRSLDWLWAVHCETSSGILNDIELFAELCVPRGIRLCLDCISSIGNVPVDLSETYLASCVSGKGLAAFPGLSMVFYNHEIAPAQHALPRYLDLALYAARDGVPFTTSSNLLYALRGALQQFDPGRFQMIQAVSGWLRSELTNAGFKLIGTSAANSPAVTTIELPETTSSEWFGRILNEAGYQLSYRSQYLRERNWIQVCLMGDVDQESLIPLVTLLGRLHTAKNGDRKANS